MTAMTVSYYYLDQLVFNKLKTQAEDNLDNWQGEASTIASYVASWGVLRFWAMSRSYKRKNGEDGQAANGQQDDDQTYRDSDGQRRYFAWKVARLVLCEVVGHDLGITAKMTTEEFQKRLDELNMNQQVLLVDLLIEIADGIQFWTMRLKDAKASKTLP